MSLGLDKHESSLASFWLVWGRVVDELFVSSGLDKHEWMQAIKGGESSLASFRVLVKERVDGLRKD